MRDRPHGLAHLVRSRLHAEPIGPADRLFRLDIEPHDPRRQPRTQQPRNTPHRADLPVKIEEVHIALGRAIELDQPLDPRALDELFPHIRAQAVAEPLGDLVALLQRARRLVHQIAAKLTDIDQHGGVVVDRLLPEVRRREFAAQDDARPRIQRRPNTAHAARRMIERQRQQDALIVPRLRRVLEHAHQSPRPHARDLRSLRQTRRARRVDVERNLAALHARANRLLHPPRRRLVHGLVDLHQPIHRTA